MNLVTKAGVLSYLAQKSEPVRFGTMLMDFEIYDNDQAKKVKLQAVLDKLVDAKQVVNAKTGSMALSLFGAGILKLMGVSDSELTEDIYSLPPKSL
jgi:hypothetical protein